jgi:enamine deaminase RidA (YjgF/YER057c/UK114 family)
MSIDRSVITTKNAPGPALHNSQAIVSNGPLIFVSGQTGIDIKTGKLVEGPIKNRVVSFICSLDYVVETIN